jgi:hypothetical protein
MRIYLDLDSRQLLSTPNRAIRNLEFKRRDNDSLELQFVRNGTVVSVPSGTTVQYGLKPINQYASVFFSTGAFSKVGSGEAAIFTAVFTLNTQPIAQAFDLEPKSISAMLEIEVRDGDTVASSATLPTTIHNDVIRGDEATPAAIPDGKASQAEAQAGTDNAKWMTPLRTKQAITQAAGSYAPATGILPSAISGTAVVNADPRLNDSRQPTAHNSTHATSGSDPITPAAIGAVNGYGVPPDSNVAPAAMELLDEDTRESALKCDNSTDGWFVRYPDNFREAVGAASAAQGAKADTSLQQGAYISAASLEVGSIAAGQTPDLYVGQNGKVGIGTETCSEKLTVNGNIALSGGQVKGLGTPVDATDAVRKSDLEGKFPTPPASGSYALRSVDGVVSWVEE